MCGRRLGVGSHDKQATRCESMQVLADDVAEPTADLVANHRVADLAADGETDPGGLVHVIPELQV